ncbi:MAG: gluconokinase [Granulosicoccus sp.]|nr:gluconokinase [Granulosicoccus sp.]
MTRLYVVMGVAGSGKSSIGTAIANAVGGTYIDGDDYHPAANIEKMSRGDPLGDDDRWPWLETVAKELQAIEGIALIGCSALKKTYRDLIRKACKEPVTFIFLSGSKDLIASRMASREGHFMPTTLLDSQFSTLEVPTTEELVLTVDIDATPESIVKRVIEQLGSSA